MINKDPQTSVNVKSLITRDEQEVYEVEREGEDFFLAVIRRKSVKGKAQRAKMAERIRRKLFENLSHTNLMEVEKSWSDGRDFY